MTVSASYAPLVSAGNDVTVAFSPTWVFFSSAEIKVTLIDSDGVETVKSLTTHYTVSGGADSDGLPSTGTITMLTAPATGETLVIERVTTNTQATSYANNDAFGAKTHEAAYDRRTLVEQEAKEIAGRALQANPKLTLTGRNFKVAGTGWIKWDDTDGFTVNPAASAGDMEAATYDAAGIEEQLVGLTAIQTLTNKTLTQPVITLEQSTSIAPTAEGRIAWDTDDNKIKVGDGATTKTFSDDSVNAATYAPLDSPALIGAPTSPTADVGTNTTQIATTAFVKTALDALIASAPGALDTLDELAAALGDDANFASTITTALAGKVATADLASQAQAEAGTDNTKWMTPLRTAQAIGALGGGGGSGVSSFNGRTGAVSPAADDYELSDITGAQAAIDAKLSVGSVSGDGSAQKIWHMKGGGSGYTAAHGVLETAAAGRGLGFYGWDSATGVEWFWGRPYSASDRFIIARQASISSGSEGLATAQQTYALLDVDTTRMKIGMPALWQGLGAFAKFQRAGQSFEKWQLALSEANGNLSISMINESTGATISESVQINNGTGKIYNRGVKVLNDEDLASQAQAEAGTDNTVWTSPLRVAQAIAALGGGGIKGFQEFKASGTYTRTSGATKALVIAIGGGGGGYGSGVGGGSGEVRWALVTPGSSETVTIGAAGAIGGDGGNTSFGSHVTANGGVGTGSGAAGSGGSGGSEFPAGSGAGQDGSGNYGRGGSNMFGQGGVRMSATNYNPTGYGAGGIGDSSGSTAGTAGIIIVIEF